MYSPSIYSPLIGHHDIHYYLYSLSFKSFPLPHPSLIPYLFSWMFTDP